MAGSYSHVEHGWSLVENMGDAAETVEELLWLAWYFASGRGRAGFGFLGVVHTDLHIRRVLDEIYYPMCRGELPKDEFFLAVQDRMEK